MIIESIAAGYLIGSFIYHRLFDIAPGKRPPLQEFAIPKIDAGTMVPLLYGKYRVRVPVLAWRGSVRAEVGSVGNGSPDAAPGFVYQMSMLFVLGIPFAEGRGSSSITGMWAGDTKMSFDAGLGIAEMPRVTDSGTASPILIYHGGSIEVLDGGPTQDIDASAIGLKMTSDVDDPVPADEVPGLRGYLSIGLFGAVTRWQVGDSPQIPAYSFEHETFAGSAYSGLTTHPIILVDDANPATVIYDVLASPQKLGIPTSAIDLPSFQAAEETLWDEGHGFSYCFSEPVTADELIQMVLRQIDGVLRWNATTGKIEIKLVRADFDPASIPHITKDNCVKLQGFAMGGWSNVSNAFDVVFSDREQDYQDDTVSYDNQANTAQHGSDRLILQYPGCCRRAVAEMIRDREVAARSRPVMKCRAIVDRSFLRVSVGDAVKLTWSKPDISGVIFRVADVDRGSLEDGAISLDLVQDVTQVWRGGLVGPQHDAPQLEL